MNKAHSFFDVHFRLEFHSKFLYNWFLIIFFLFQAFFCLFILQTISSANNFALVGVIFHSDFLSNFYIFFHIVDFQLKTSETKIPKLTMPLQNSGPSTTKIALYLLRFNVALQIAVTAIIVNLILAVFTFYYGFNALYCAFGADCVIGVLTAIILVWRFASSKQTTMTPTEHIYLLRDPRRDAINQMQGSLSLVSSQKYAMFDSTIIRDDEDHAREQWSTFWLGQVMILSGTGVIIRTLVEICGDGHEQPPMDNIFDLVQWFRSPTASIVSLFLPKKNVLFHNNCLVLSLLDGASLHPRSDLTYFELGFDVFQNLRLLLPQLKFNADRGRKLFDLCNLRHNHNAFNSLFRFNTVFRRSC